MPHSRKMPENRPQKRWFKAKRYGLGWIPITWQGWTVTLAYAFLLTSSAVNFTRIAATSPDALGTTFDSDLLIGRFVLWIVTLTIFMLWICYKTGDAPHWHWSSKSSRDKAR